MIFGFRKQKKEVKKTTSDYKMETLVRFGREQLMRLRDKGINIPVALL